MISIGTVTSGAIMFFRASHRFARIGRLSSDSGSSPCSNRLSFRGMPLFLVADVGFGHDCISAVIFSENSCGVSEAVTALGISYLG